MIETNAYTTNMNQSELLNDGVDWLRQRFGDVTEATGTNSKRRLRDIIKKDKRAKK